METKKRRKSSRFRGSHTHGRGGKKKARGSGHRGGFGMAGTGKRADQRKTFVLNQKEKYFGKSKTLRRGKKAEIKEISLRTISDSVKNLIKHGRAKEEKGVYHLKLDNYKIIGNGIDIKVHIEALSASMGAIQAVEKAGGKIILKDIKKKKDKNQFS